MTSEKGRKVAGKTGGGFGLKVGDWANFMRGELNE
jgi:hypothetical protein